MSVIETLTEGIRQRSLAHEGEALLSKWEKTGLLEGLGDSERSQMSRLLENQAAQLLKETTTMQAGDVEGFASVAFPLVRRVFGGLLAQDLVSVQPMSLPSGLIFFLDFVYSADGSTMPRLGRASDASFYGGGVVARNLTGGVDLANAGGQSSFYSLANGYSSPTGTIDKHSNRLVFEAQNTFGDSGSLPGGAYYTLLSREPALVSGTSEYAIYRVAKSHLTGFNASDLQGIVVGTGTLSANSYHARGLTAYSGTAESDIYLVGISVNGLANGTAISASMKGGGSAIKDKLSFPITDEFVAAGSPFGAIAGSDSSTGS